MKKVHRPMTPERLVARETAGHETVADREAKAEHEQHMRRLYSAQASELQARSALYDASRALDDAERKVIARSEALAEYKSNKGQDYTMADLNNFHLQLEMALEWAATCKRKLADAQAHAINAAECFAAANAAINAAVAA